MQTNTLLQNINIWLCVCAKSLELCLTLCDPMDCSSSGSSVLQSLMSPGLTNGFFTTSTTWEAHIIWLPKSELHSGRHSKTNLSLQLPSFFDSACKIFDINSASLITCIWHESKTLLRISVFESKLFLLLKKKKPRFLNFKRVSSHLELYS